MTVHRRWPARANTNKGVGTDPDLGQLPLHTPRLPLRSLILEAQIFHPAVTSPTDPIAALCMSWSYDLSPHTTRTSSFLAPCPRPQRCGLVSECAFVWDAPSA